MTRARWHLGTGSLVLAWLAASVVIALLQRNLPASVWLMVHVTLLGAATNAIVIWSAHFSSALARLPDKPDRRDEIARLIVLNVSVITLLVAVVRGVWPMTLISGLAIVAVIAWHTWELLSRMRRALPSRFGATVRYYLLAGLFLMIGVGLGVLSSRGGFDLRLQIGLVIAHATVNVLGWIGLTIVGTLVTLWPTILRTQAAAGAERAARLALPILVAGISVIALGSLIGVRFGVVLGLLGYLAGLVVASRPMLAETRKKPPVSFAAWSVLAGWVWFLFCIAALAVIAAISPTWEQITQRAGALTSLLVVGFVAQVLAGSLSYLLPVMAGGGPQPIRWRNAVVDRAAMARVAATNVALVFAALPVADSVKTVASAVALLTLAAALPLLARAMMRPPDSAVGPRGTSGPEPPKGAVGGTVVGVSVTLLALAAAVGAAPPETTPATATTVSQVATGHTETVDVRMRGMRYIPDQVRVNPGDALIINVINEGDDVHDLVLETGQRTPRMQPGESAQLDVGVVERQLDGWCSVAGHRQMGMVFTVLVNDEPAGMAQHSDGHEASAASAADDLDLMAEPAAGFKAHDPRLPPAPPGRVHRVRLEVTQQEQEVAPGVVQTRWMFGGSAPGPTLRGRIGDRFEIELVNSGDIGHSIDFHAGSLAPDKPMRTIAPGQSLRYTFTATKAGIWMYHCSTMPMSMHIANGMFGAVIIDPPDLEPVDKEFVLVSSEAYLGPQAGTADMAKIQAERPDLVTFNGYANQYDYDPLEVEVGQRIRIWVLSAGPNRGTAFHVVGGQFDTVYQEGDYLLQRAAGGSQVLGLSVAQGGFVELSLPQPGNYPFVSHAMVDAERGAHGILRATD